MPIPTTNAKPKTFDELVDAQASRHRVDRAARRRVDAEERPPVVYPPVQSLTGLLVKNLGVQQFRIDQVLPADGRAILAAQYKAGKTTMLGNLMRSLVDGTPFLGAFDAHIPASAVVLVDDEMSPRQVQHWLRDQGIVNQDKVVDVVTLRGNLGSFNLLDDDCRQIWANRFKGLRCDYLILDCLRPLLDILGLSEDKEAGQFLTRFDALLYESGIPDACLVHHMGHANERTRGDSRLRDWPDSTLTMVREDPENDNSPRYFSVLGRDTRVPEGRLSFDAKTRHLTYAAGSRVDVKVEAALKAVTELLAEDFRNGGTGLSGNAVENGLMPEHTRAKTQAAIAKDLSSPNPRISKTTGGPRGAHIHTIVSPCSVCGMPVTVAGMNTHLNCKGTGP